MSEYICKTCQNMYNKNQNIPIILSCGDTLCSSCIKNYKDAMKKDVFECPKCCNDTHSLNIENKSLYQKDNMTNANNNSRTPINGEFEIFIRPKGEVEKYSIKVTKSMTVGQLKDKIEKEKGYNKKYFTLAFTRPLNEESKTLEFYKITRTVTLTQISFVQGGF